MASDENKALARYLKARFDRDVAVVRFHDGNDASSVDILNAPDTPDAGVVAYATVCLSDHALNKDLEGAPLRVELLIAAHAEFADAPNILATCAFNMLNSGYAAAPGLVHPHVMKMYLPNSDMKHVMLAAPFSWALETQRFPAKTVAWLQLLPISEAELRFREENDEDALEAMLEQCAIDPFDLNRRSVL